jgi:hypothetical protein
MNKYDTCGKDLDLEEAHSLMSMKRELGTKIYVLFQLAVPSLICEPTMVLKRSISCIQQISGIVDKLKR